MNAPVVSSALHALPYERLVDGRTGLVRSVQRIPSLPELPAAYIALRADVANTRHFSVWQADRTALGAAFYDEKKAWASAIGEAMERYCGNFVPAHALRRATYTQLLAEGENVLDPYELILYSDSQYTQPGFPCVPFTHDVPVLWTRGEDMSTGDPILVPASVVYLNYYSGARIHEPPTNYPMFSGIAAGPSRAEAERSALEELLERDATTIWWHSQSPMPLIEMACEPAIQAALYTPANSGTIDYFLLHLRTPFAVPVVAAFLRDRTHEIVTLGFACRADPLQAALKALIEAIHLRSFHLNLLDPEGDVWRAMQAGILNAKAYKGYRADRSYMDAYRADFHDVVDLGCQAQMYLDPRMHVHVDDLLKTTERVTLADLPRVTESDARMAYLRRLHEHGQRAISVDLTTPDVRSAGISVVRVIVPGLYPNAPAAFPFLGGRRLYEEPAALGWLPAPLTEAMLRLAPMPHN